MSKKSLNPPFWADMGQIKGTVEDGSSDMETKLKEICAGCSKKFVNSEVLYIQKGNFCTPCNQEVNFRIKMRIEFGKENKGEFKYLLKGYEAMNPTVSWEESNKV